MPEKIDVSMNESNRRTNYIENSVHLILGRGQRRVLFGFDAHRSDCAPKQKHRRKLLLVSIQRYNIEFV